MYFFIFSFDPNPLVRHTFWTLVIGGFVTSMTIYSSNQAMIQRYLSMSTLRRAQTWVLMLSDFCTVLWWQATILWFGYYVFSVSFSSTVISSLGKKGVSRYTDHLLVSTVFGFIFYTLPFSGMRSLIVALPGDFVIVLFYYLLALFLLSAHFHSAYQRWLGVINLLKKVFDFKDRIWIFISRNYSQGEHEILHPIGRSTSLFMSIWDLVFQDSIYSLAYMQTLLLIFLNIKIITRCT